MANKKIKFAGIFKNFAFYLTLLTAQTTTAAHAQQGEAKVIEVLQTNSVTLSGGSAWDFGTKRRLLKGLHDASSWNQLAKEVLLLKYDSDLSYYYLARSSEGLGEVEAAKRYYYLALSAKKCDGLINNCDGFVFPKDIDSRLEHIKNSGVRSTANENKSKILVSLPPQWITAPLQTQQILKGVFHIAKHESLGAVAFFTKTKYDPNVSLLTLVNLKINRDAKEIIESKIIEATELKINGNIAARGEIIGKVNNSSKPIHWQITLQKIDDSVVESMVWIPQDGFTAFRDYIEKIPNYVQLDAIKDESRLASLSSNLEKNTDTVTIASSNLPANTIDAQKPKLPEEKNTTGSFIPSVGSRRALVIGNDTYKNVQKLNNAREDAKTIAANLTAFGYSVTLKLDLNEKEMKAALRTFSSQVQGGDEVMFFFAGHGVQLGSSNYLLPVDILGDSEAQVRDEAIQLQRVLDDMSDRKAKFTLAMIDACRDNPFKTSGRAIGGRGLSPTTAATGQMVIFSAGAGQQALDKLSNSDKSKNGLFTRIFVQEMQKPNLSIDRIVKNVRNQVADLAKSVGHEQVPAIYDQVLGDFFFNVSK